jgi:hypothetical protein
MSSTRKDPGMPGIIIKRQAGRVETAKLSTTTSSSCFSPGHFDAVLQRRLLVFELLQVRLEPFDVRHRRGQHHCFAGLGPFAADLFFQMGDVRNRLPEILKSAVQSNSVLSLDFCVRDSLNDPVAFTGTGCSIAFAASILRQLLQVSDVAITGAVTYSGTCQAVRVLNDPTMIMASRKTGSARARFVWPDSVWHTREFTLVELWRFNKTVERA